jgi:hypothetical protein
MTVFATYGIGFYVVRALAWALRPHAAHLQALEIMDGDYTVE